MFSPLCPTTVLETRDFRVIGLVVGQLFGAGGLVSLKLVGVVVGDVVFVHFVLLVVIRWFQFFSVIF